MRYLEQSNSENRMLVTRSGSEGAIQNYHQMTEYSKWNDENVLEMYNGDVCTKGECTQCIELYT